MITDALLAFGSLGLTAIAASGLSSFGFRRAREARCARDAPPTGMTFLRYGCVRAGACPS